MKCPDCPHDEITHQEGGLSENLIVRSGCRFCDCTRTPKSFELSEEDAFRIASFGKDTRVVCRHRYVKLTESLDGMTLTIFCPECNTSAAVGIATYNGMKR